MEQCRVNIRSKFLEHSVATQVYNTISSKCKNVARVWLQLVYEAKNKKERVTHHTPNISFFFFPGETTQKTITDKIYEVLAQLCDNLDGSGWSVHYLYEFSIKCVQDSEFDCTDPTAKNNNKCITVKCPIEQSLPYSVYAALHPVDKNPGRASQYKVEFFVSDFEQLSHFYKTEILCLEQTSAEKARIKYHTNNGYPGSISLIFGSDYYYHVLKTNVKRHCRVCPTCLSRNRDDRPHGHDKEFIVSDKDIKFDNFKYVYKKPVVVFADFEALQLPTDIDRAGVTHIQVPCTACAVLLVNDEIKGIYKNTSKECVDNFIEMMYEWHRDYVRNQYKRTPKESIEEQTTCVICDRLVDEEDRCHHHDHITGESIGLAHSSCNKKLKFTPSLDIIFHNFAGYDSKHIISYLSERLKTKFENVIAKGTEKFLSFSVESEHRKLRFIDSFQFLLQGVDKLYKEDPAAGRLYLEEIYPLYNEDGKLKVDFQDFNSWEMLEQPYKGFDTARDYFEYYCMGDTLIIAGVFKKFRDAIYSSYKIDVLHCVGAPSVTWNAALKYSGVVLKPYEDYETYRLFKDNIRGGYTNCNVHDAKTDEKGVIQSFDINALYSWAMTQALPLGDFEEVALESKLWDKDYSTEDAYCYFILADWVFPKEIHDKLSQLPPFATVIDSRLVADLRDKNDYLTHSCTYHQAKTLGAVPTVKKVLRCHQNPFFESYVRNNIKLRKEQPKGSTASATFKLLNNSLYGKTIENVEKYTAVKIEDRTDIEKKGKKLFCSVNAPIEMGRHFVRDREKNQCVMSKPTYVGFAVLELSKWKMIDQWYRNFAPHNSELLYMDTDSFYVKTPLPLKIHSEELGEFKDELNGQYIDHFIGLCAKSYAYRYGDKEEVKLKGVSNKRKAVTFDDYVAKKLKKVEQSPMKSIDNKMYTCATMKTAINPNHVDSKRYQCRDGIHTLPFGHYLVEQEETGLPLYMCI